MSTPKPKYVMMVQKIEYIRGSYIFRYNEDTNVIQVSGGTPDDVQVAISKLRAEKTFPKKLKAIWFSGNPAILLVGYELTIYLTAHKPKPKRKDRSFADIIKRK